MIPLDQNEKINNSIVSGINTTKFENSNILVTGGAGFLGSWLCESLLKLKANVICLDNYFSGNEENIIKLKKITNFKFIKHDISTPFFYEEKIDYIFHLASRASPFEFSRFPIQILKANTLGTWIVLGIALKHDSTLLYASTSEVYGDPDPSKIPTDETYNGNVNPIGERACYDEAKRAGEAFAMAYLLQHDLNVRIVRIFNTYGPRIKAGNLYGRVIPNFITQSLKNEPIKIFGDGNQTRSFSYVSDTIKGIILSQIKENTKGEVINIGNENEKSILDLANLIKKIIKSDSQIHFLPPKPDDPKRRCPNINKAKKLLNWLPKVNLEDGLNETIQWFKKKILS